MLKSFAKKKGKGNEEEKARRIEKGERENSRVLGCVKNYFVYINLFWIHALLCSVEKKTTIHDDTTLVVSAINKTGRD